MEVDSATLYTKRLSSEISSAVTDVSDYCESSGYVKGRAKLAI
jgi:hypothetical protein